MKYATEEMHRQLIALTSTSVDRRKLDSDRLQIAMSNPEIYCEQFAEWINAWQEPAPTVVEQIKYLQPVTGAESLILDPTDGTRTFAESADIFTGYLDPDFQKWGTNIKGAPTEAQKVSVHELTLGGSFAQIYGCLSDNLDSLCFSQDQIIQFVQKHRNWLHPKGWATFFLFKAGNEFFVASVRINDRGQLDADVYRFSRGGVWGAGSRHRFMIPQLVTQTS